MGGIELNNRITLAEIAEHLKIALAHIDGLQIQTSLQRNFLTDYGKAYPAVWVRAQRYTPDDNGRGYSSHYRQHGTVSISFTIVVQRYQTGNYDPETALADLQDELCKAMLEFQAQTADAPFTLAAWQDGAEAESVASSDVVFSTKFTYQEQ